MQASKTPIVQVMSATSDRNVDSKSERIVTECDIVVPQYETKGDIATTQCDTVTTESNTTSTQCATVTTESDTTSTQCDTVKIESDTTLALFQTEKTGGDTIIIQSHTVKPEDDFEDAFLKATLQASITEVESDTRDENAFTVESKCCVMDGDIPEASCEQQEEKDPVQLYDRPPIVIMPDTDRESCVPNAQPADTNVQRHITKTPVRIKPLTSADTFTAGPTKNLFKLVKGVKGNMKVFQFNRATKNFHFIGKLIKRQNVQQGEKPYIYEACGEIRPLENALAQYLEANGGTSKRAPQSKKLKVNMGKHQSFLCGSCGTSFTSEANMRIHLPSCYKTCDVSVKRKYKCETCGDAFIHNSELIEHMKVHQEHKCRVCQARFLTKEERWRHDCLKHLNEKAQVRTKNMFKCENCGQGFEKQSFLIWHKAEKKCGKS